MNLIHYTLITLLKINESHISHTTKKIFTKQLITTDSFTNLLMCIPNNKIPCNLVLNIINSTLKTKTYSDLLNRTYSMKIGVKEKKGVC